ncbi:MAG: hypothetical protein EBY29_13805 [Planctomycetes bacterium]|nr:hypothetical protein [Planctomycetota bacterium]
MIGQHRSVQRRRCVKNTCRIHLASRSHALSRKHPSRGWRHVQDLLGREGWRVNHKPLRHVWREEGLKVPQTRRKMRRIGSAQSGILRKQAIRKNQVWGMDFIFDWTANGRPIKILVVLDECTRENLALEVSRKPKSHDVIRVLTS